MAARFSNSHRKSGLRTNLSESWFTRCYGELKGRSLNTPSWLLVVNSMAVGACIELSYNILFGFEMEPDKCQSLFPSFNKEVSHAIPSLHALILTGLYFFMGWLADTKIGRKKAIDLSLWSCWFGTLLQVVSYCIQYGTCGVPVNIAKYGISSVALVLILIGNSSFLANVLAYGMDQLVNESNAQVRAFIHWIVWGLFVGFLFGYISFVKNSIYDVKLLLVTGIVIFAIVSLTVIVNIFFINHFNPSGILVENPYTKVFNVLMYAYRHKYPESRSAFTYWESKLPSRIDLGKRKYGGPFAEGEVEDVKVFLRIVAVCVSLFGLYIPYSVVFGNFFLIEQFKDGSTSFYGYGSYILWNAFDEMGVFLVPLLELILIPVLPKVEYFLLNPIRGLAISYVFLLMSLISMLILVIIGQFLSHENVSCSSGSTYDLSFLYLSIPFTFYGLASFISFVYGLEFICSQTPIHMSGMLTGTYWLLRSFYTNIGGIINTVFRIKNLNGPGRVDCNFWIFVIQLFICFMGFLVFIGVSKWYQHRVRSEQYDTMAVIEEKYDRNLTSSTHEERSDPKMYSPNWSYEGYLHDYIIETLH